MAAPLSLDSFPYEYPVFHSDGSSALVYSQTVELGRLWLESSDADDVRLRQLAQQIQQRCWTHSSECAWTDSCGDTALHRLAQIARVGNKTSLKTLVDVVKVLILAHPHCATKARNNWGETPLHQFVSHCGLPDHPAHSTRSEDKEQPFPGKDHLLQLVHLLARGNACSVRNCWGALPLHEACGLSLWTPPMDTAANSTPRTFRMACSTNQLPTVYQNLHDQVIQYLVSQNPQSVSAEDRHCERIPLQRALNSLKCSTVVLQRLISLTPIHCKNSKLWDPLWQHYADIEKQHPLLLQKVSPSKVTDHFGPLWDATLTVLSSVSSSSNPLHAALECDAPDCALRWLVQKFPQPRALLLQPFPKTRVTPLVACLQKGRSTQLIEWMVHFCPATATIPVDDKLPLRWALDCTATKTPGHETMIRTVWVAHPEAAIERDMETQLFPFALVDASSISYELLRSAPTVLEWQQEVPFDW